MKTTELTIQFFMPGDESIFRALNEAWINEYFVLEPDDELVLGDPQAHILRPGGEIFIARANGVAVGCCALIVKGAGMLELAKMAVDPNYQGHGIGRKLLTHAIEWAKARGARALVLGSNTRLEEALHLYESSGFRRLKNEDAPHMHYERANVFMRLELAGCEVQAEDHEFQSERFPY